MGAKNTVKPLAGYEEWSQRVREPLIWLGEEDPCKCMDAVWASDPYREQLTAVLAQWRLKLVVGQAYTIKQVIERAIVDQDFFNALAAVASNKTGTSISNDRLGRWLHKNAGKIVDGHRLEAGAMQASGKLWRCYKA